MEINKERKLKDFEGERALIYGRVCFITKEFKKMRITPEYLTELATLRADYDRCTLEIAILREELDKEWEKK